MGLPVFSLLDGYRPHVRVSSLPEMWLLDETVVRRQPDVLVRCLAVLRSSSTWPVRLLALYKGATGANINQFDLARLGCKKH